MSYLTSLRDFYPTTWKVRWALQNYNTHIDFEHKEPTTITVHETVLRYGGPHEGGWYWQQGYPERTYCIFSKKQAIKTFLEACEEYEVWDQPDLGLSTTNYNWEISFSNNYVKIYPTERPQYE